MGFAQEDKVLMTINGEPIMTSEFLYIYEKNNQETSLEKKTMDEYLDLFVNFKLKVAEAIAQGVDTTEAFKKELAGYRAQATPKYMQDDAAIDSLVVLSYNRMANIRKASHIAVQCPQDADSATVAAALVKINELREKVAESSVTKTAETVDLTRTPDPIELGTRHPLSLVREQIIDIFSRVGFTVAEGPEVEDDKHVYGLLNFAPEHPARDMQDTFYLEYPNVLLRSHTSCVQIRYMLWIPIIKLL